MQGSGLARSREVMEPVAMMQEEYGKLQEEPGEEMGERER